MRFIFSFSVLGLLATTASAQTIKGTYDPKTKTFTPEDNKSYQVDKFHDGIAIFRYQNLDGFMDSTGRIICEAKYEELETFSGEVAAAMKIENGYELKYGYIDKKGKEVIPVIYDYIDHGFDRALRFDGLLLVRKGDREGLYNVKGKLVAPLIYNSIHGCHSGMSKMYRDGKIGYLDKDGKEAVPPVYESGYDFSGELARVKKNGKWGFINTKGKEVIPFIYDNVSDSWGNWIKAQKDGKHGCIDAQGKVVLAFEYESLGYFVEGKAHAKKDGKFGYINKEAKVVIPFEYEWASNFHLGLSHVKKDGKWGHIDSTGKTTTPFIYDKTGEFHTTGLAAVEINGKSGRVDRNGNIVIPCRFKGMSGLVNGAECVSEETDAGRKWGFYDLKGNEIVPVVYDRAANFSKDGLAQVKRGELWGYVDLSGKEVIPCIYLHTEPFNNGKALVRTVEKQFYINKKGEVVDK